LEARNIVFDNMNIRPIKTEVDYNDSVKRIEALWGAKRDTPEGDEFDLLCTLVESYEMAHYPIAPPDPIDAILFRMEQMDMTKTDMAKYLGSQSRVSEVLGRKRKLTLKMVKSLYKGLKIPAEILPT
jgi:HTH-type transcriptional regulator/antitoxin HigA